MPLCSFALLHPCPFVPLPENYGLFRFNCVGIRIDGAAKSVYPITEARLGDILAQG
jgi:hypothetical protein